MDKLNFSDSCSTQHFLCDRNTTLGIKPVRHATPYVLTSSKSSVSHKYRSLTYTFHQVKHVLQVDFNLDNDMTMVVVDIHDILVEGSMS